MKRNVSFQVEIPEQVIEVDNVDEGACLLECLAEVSVDCFISCDVYWTEPDDMEVLKEVLKNDP